MDWHQFIGIAKFIIYDNEGTDDIKNILQPYINAGVVDYYYLPGKAQQVRAYNDVIYRVKGLCKWLAIIDADEFIVPLDCDDIGSFLESFTDYGALGINWIMYDSNGHEVTPSGGCLKSFTRVHCDKKMYFKELPYFSKKS